MARTFTLTIDQAQLDALTVVRNMAYEHQDQGAVLHDLPDELEGQDGLDFQEAALDVVDALLIKAKIGG